MSEARGQGQTKSRRRWGERDGSQRDREGGRETERCTERERGRERERERREREIEGDSVRMRQRE